MRRFLSLVLVAVLAAPLMAGCAGGIDTYTVSGQAISIGTGQEFIIALGSNPTTGYGWQESYDEAMLELVAKTYEPGKAAKEGLVGAGGVEYFRFKALKKGTTRITLSYKRTWEEDVLDEEVFTVDIK